MDSKDFAMVNRRGDLFSEMTRDATKHISMSPTTDMARQAAMHANSPAVELMQQQAKHRQQHDHLIQANRLHDMVPQRTPPPPLAKSLPPQHIKPDHGLQEARHSNTLLESLIERQDAMAEEQHRAVKRERLMIALMVATLVVAAVVPIILDLL